MMGKRIENKQGSKLTFIEIYCLIWPLGIGILKLFLRPRHVTGWGVGPGGCPRAISSSVLFMNKLESLLRATPNWAAGAPCGSLRPMN